MILVTVQAITYETGSAGQQLFAIEIVNDKTGDSVVANYTVSLFDKDGTEIAAGHVKGHWRQDGALALARKAIEAVKA